MTATMTPTADRMAHREATRRMRTNAGIETIARPDALADFGAAARRLRASNVFGPSHHCDAAEPVIDIRQQAAHVDSHRRNTLLAGRASSLLASLQHESA